MLEITDMQTGYGRTQVISGVSITVPDNALVAIMGHNGAGKTTLLRAVVGLLKPTRGSIRLDGEDITALPPHQRVARGMAYVPQGQQSFGQLTAQENLQLVADGRKNGKERVAEALDMFPALRPLLSRRAGLLSGGQRQQLAIARALVTSPGSSSWMNPRKASSPTWLPKSRRPSSSCPSAGGCRSCWWNSTSGLPSRPPTATTCWPPAGSVLPGRAASDPRRSA